MLGIIILNYNTWEMTIQCADSILKTCNQDYTIYIVDNGSTNNSYHYLKEKYGNNKNVIVLDAEENSGYAKGNNIGIRYAFEDGKDIIAIANNDVIFLDDTLEHMYAFLKNNKHASAVSPYILSPDGELHNLPSFKPIKIRDYLIYYTRLSKFITLKSKMHHNNEYYLSSNSINNQPIPIYKFSGCCFMVRGEMLMNLGLLDENTFLYFEEDILCHKMYKSNYKAYFLPDSKVVHYHGLTTGKENLFVDTEMLKSEMYFLSRYYQANFIIMLYIYIDRAVSPIIKKFKNRYSNVTFKDYIVFLRITWKNFIKFSRQKK